MRPFEAKKELNYAAIKDMRNLFRMEKETKVIKDRRRNYYKPIRVNNFWSNNYIKYKNKGDSNKTISVEEYYDKFRPYLKDMINNLKKSNT